MLREKRVTNFQMVGSIAHMPLQWPAQFQERFLPNVQLMLTLFLLTPKQAENAIEFLFSN